MSLSETVIFHITRHFFAANLLIYETDVKTVSSLLGHASLNHTRKYI
ncbi:tyrosine-type recombinase/integrase [Spirosoma luteum]